MKRCAGMLMAIVFAVTVSIAQQTTDTTAKTTQVQSANVKVADSKALKKSTGIAPPAKPVTNWSKIKDIFL